MSAEKDLLGKIAIVTGASRGIGRAIAEKLAEHGANIVIASTKESKKQAAEVLSVIRSYGQEGLWISGDLSKEKKGADLIQNTLDVFRRIDILVHCAGINSDELMVKMSGDIWRRVIQTNLDSAFYVSKPAVNQMVKQKEGSIVFVSSISAHGTPGQANYAASKAGIEGLMRTMAVEYMSARRPIRTNAVACGLVDTDMATRLSDEQRVAIISGSPLGRIITPVEVAEVVTFLASPKASAVNGAIWDIDGGTLRR